jgi:hypothetical protein
LLVAPDGSAYGCSRFTGAWKVLKRSSTKPVACDGHDRPHFRSANIMTKEEVFGLPSDQAHGSEMACKLSHATSIILVVQRAQSCVWIHLQ